MKPELWQGSSLDGNFDRASAEARAALSAGAAIVAAAIVLPGVLRPARIQPDIAANALFLESQPRQRRSSPSRSTRSAGLRWT